LNGKWALHLFADRDVDAQRLGEFTEKGFVAAREVKTSSTKPGAKPAGAAATLGTNPTGTKPPPDKGPAGHGQATLNGGAP
jgi:hypothetical protein